MKSFDFKSEHKVTIASDALFCKLSRVQRTAVLSAMAYVPLDLLAANRDKFNPATKEGREAYDSMTAQCRAKLDTAGTINDLLAGGRKPDELSAAQQAVTVGALGLTTEVSYMAMFDNLTQSEQNKLMRAYIESVNAELAK